MCDSRSISPFQFSLLGTENGERLQNNGREEVDGLFSFPIAAANEAPPKGKNWAIRPVSAPDNGPINIKSAGHFVLRLIFLLIGVAPQKTKMFLVGCCSSYPTKICSEMARSR